MNVGVKLVWFWTEKTTWKCKGREIATPSRVGNSRSHNTTIKTTNNYLLVTSNSWLPLT